MKDLIIVAAHTGGRLNELCNMTLNNFGGDWLQVVDSKTKSGIRKIPIHKDFQQLIERLKQTGVDTGDDYLFQN